MKDRIKLLRMQNGFTQEQIAYKLNVTVKTYRSYEKGCDIPCTLAHELAKIYSVSVDYLMGYSDFANIGNAEVHQITGLSDYAIELLRMDKESNITHLSDIICHLLTCADGRATLSELYFYIFGSYGSGSAVFGDRIVTAEDVKNLELTDIFAHIVRMKDHLSE